MHSGAAIEETFLILRRYVEGKEDWKRVRRAVLQHNLLGKRSTQRARHILEAVRRRFLRAPDWLPPARYVGRFGMLEAGAKCRENIVLAYLAAEDALFHDVLRESLSKLLSGDRAPLKRDIIRIAASLRASADENPPFWSPSMERRWAEGFLAIARRAGFIRENGLGSFDRPLVRAEAFAFLFLWVYPREGSVRRTVRHRAFDPFLLTEEDCRRLLDDGRQRGWWGYTGTRAFVEMAPKPPTLEDWLDGLGQGTL